MFICAICGFIKTHRTDVLDSSDFSDYPDEAKIILIGQIKHEVGC